MALNHCLGNFETESERIKESHSIIIAIDTIVPEGNPSTVNIETLKSLISYIKQLKSGNKADITILPCTLWGIYQQKTLEFLGIQSLIIQEEIKLLFYDETSNIMHIT